MCVIQQKMYVLKLSFFHKSLKWKIPADTTKTLTPQTHGALARIHSPWHTDSHLQLVKVQLYLRLGVYLNHTAQGELAHLWIGMDYLLTHTRESEYLAQQVPKQSFLTETVYQIQHKFDRKKYCQALVWAPLWNSINRDGNKTVWKTVLHLESRYPCVHTWATLRTPWSWPICLESLEIIKWITCKY